MQGLKFHITGIDMSREFDIINRNKLFHILSDIVNEDELGITQFLLRYNVINMKINGATNNTPSQQTPAHLKEIDWVWYFSLFI